MELAVYVHGKGGSAAEAEHYRPLFPSCAVVGVEYRSLDPREAGAEIRAQIEEQAKGHESVVLIANSIGAFFCMAGGVGELVRKAYFISPVVDMEKLICGMMASAGVTERELETRGRIPVPSGETLSWEILCWLRTHPPGWEVPTEILCGERDELTSLADAAAFAETRRAGLTVMKDGEHWFHTQEQMRFLDEWIKEKEAAAGRE